MLSNIIRKDHELWEKYPNLEVLGPDYGAAVLNANAGVIDQVETDVFEGFKLTSGIQRELRKTVAFMFGKEWFHPADESGVVVAGMGDVEPFPAVLQYRIGTIAAGKLRYVKEDEGRVGSSSDAVVMPFAQRAMIDMIMGGIHPDLTMKLIGDTARWVSSADKPGIGGKGKRESEGGGRRKARGRI